MVSKFPDNIYSVNDCQVPRVLILSLFIMKSENVWYTHINLTVFEPHSKRSNAIFVCGVCGVCGYVCGVFMGHREKI